MGAYPAEHSGQGEVLHYDLQGLLILSLAHHLHIPLYIEPGRAGKAARRLISLLYGKGPGYGLSVFFISSLPVTQTLVILVGQDDRTYTGAIPARSAHGFINVSRGLTYSYPEISLVAINLLHL